MSYEPLYCKRRQPKVRSLAGHLFYKKVDYFTVSLHTVYLLLSFWSKVPILGEQERSSQCGGDTTMTEKRTVFKIIGIALVAVLALSAIGLAAAQNKDAAQSGNGRCWASASFRR
jgi:hypothetical protein